jgi:hypothetical protein
MATIKRQKANGDWEYLQTTGEDVTVLKGKVDEVSTELAQTMNGNKPSWSVWTEFEYRGINVRWFENLVTNNDWTYAIQAALDMANSVGGGVIYFPKGTYRILGTVRMYSNTRLTGSWSAILHFDTLDFGNTSGYTSEANNFKQAGIVAHSGQWAETKISQREYSQTIYVENVWIDNLKIISNANYGDEWSTTHKCIRLHGCKNSGAIHCYIEGFKGEVLYANSYGKNISFVDNHIVNCATNALNFNGRIHDSICSRNFMYKVGQCEFTGWDNIISDNIMDTYSYDGIWLSDDNEGYEVSANIVNNRILNGNATHPAILAGSQALSNILIANNYIRGNFTNAIEVENDQNTGSVDIKGNTIIEQCTQNSGTGILAQGTQRVVVSNNTIKCNTGFLWSAIATQANTNKSTIANNFIDTIQDLRGASSNYAKVIQVPPSPATSNVKVTGNIVNGQKTDENIIELPKDNPTPNVALGKNFIVPAASSPITITNFDGGTEGQELFIRFTGSTPNITLDFSGTNLKGNNRTDYIVKQDDMLFAKKIWSNWYCVIISN